MKILEENNLTPENFVIAKLALQAILSTLTNERNTIPSSNIEFARKNMYRIIKIMQGNC